MGIAQNCKTFYWAQTPLGTDLDWITEVLNQPTAPLVFSISFGSSEAEQPLSYFGRVDKEYQKAGARGISIIYSSGDDGPFVYGGAVDTYEPGFPAGNPYITTVGATQFYSKNDPTCFQGDTYTCSTVDEIACSIATGAGITSGGGFSNHYASPSYQTAAISSYVSSIQSLAAHGANLAGRGYPDVSMIGHNAPVYINGQSSFADGTSASAPFFAGLITLLNDIRLSAGNSSLGFLNPLIYLLDQSAFRDIVEGDSNCTRVNCFASGYPTAPGWDAVTGRGSPIFSKWAEALANLPSNTSSSTSSTTDPTSSTPTLAPTSSTDSSSSKPTSTPTPTPPSSTTSPSHTSAPSTSPSPTTSSPSSASSLLTFMSLASMVLSVLATIFM